MVQRRNEGTNLRLYEQGVNEGAEVEAGTTRREPAVVKSRPFPNVAPHRGQSWFLVTILAVTVGTLSEIRLPLARVPWRSIDFVYSHYVFLQFPMCSC